MRSRLLVFLGLMTAAGIHNPKDSDPALGSAPRVGLLCRLGHLASSFGEIASMEGAGMAFADGC